MVITASFLQLNIICQHLMAKSSHKKKPQTQTKNSKLPKRSPSHNSSQSRNQPTPGERRETRNQQSNKGKVKFIIYYTDQVLDARNRALNSANGNRNSSKQKEQGKLGSQNKGISPKSKQIKKNPVRVERIKAINQKIKKSAKKQSENDSESSEEEIKSQRSSVQKGNSNNRGQQQSKRKEPESSRNGRSSQRNAVVKVEQNQQKKSSIQSDRMIDQKNSKQKQHNSQSKSIQQSSSQRSSSKNAANQMARSRSIDRSIINSSSQQSNAKRSVSVSKPLVRSQSVASNQNREQRLQRRSGHVVIEDVTPLEGKEQRRHQVSKRELKQLFVDQTIEIPQQLKQVSQEISNYKPQAKQTQHPKNLKGSQPINQQKNNNKKSRSEKNSLKSSDPEDPESDLTYNKQRGAQNNNLERGSHRLREQMKFCTEKENQNAHITMRKFVKKSLYDSDELKNLDEEEERSQSEDSEQDSDDDHIEKEYSKNTHQSKKSKKKQKKSSERYEESSDIDLNEQSVAQSQKQVRFIVEEEKEKKEPRKGILKNKKPTPYRNDSQKKDQNDEQRSRGSLLLRSRDDRGKTLIDTKSQPNQKARDMKQTKNHDYNSELSSPISRKSSVPKPQQHKFDVVGGVKSHHTFNPHQDAMNRALQGNSKQSLGPIKEKKASIPTKNITLNKLPRIQNPLTIDDEIEMDISSDSSNNAQINDVVSFLSADKRRNCEEVSDLEEVKNDQLPRPFITDMKRDKSENLPHVARQMMQIFGIPPNQFQQMQLQQLHNQMMNFQNSKLLSHQTQSSMTKFQQQQTQLKQNSSLLMSANPIFAAPLPQVPLPQQYRNGPQQMHQFEMPIAIPRQKSKRHPHRELQNIRHISMSCDADNEETPARENMMQKRGRREITQFLQSSKKFEEDLKPQVLLSSKDQSQSIGGDIQPPQTPQEELTSHKEMSKFDFEKIQIGNELLAKDQTLKLEEQRSSSHAELNELLNNPTELSKQLTFGVQKEKVPVPPQQKLSQNSVQNPQLQQGFVRVYPSPAKLLIQQPPFAQNNHFNMYPPMQQHQYMNPQMIVPGFHTYSNAPQQQAFNQAALLLNQQIHQKQQQQLANSSMHYPNMIQVPQMTLSQQFQGTPLSSQTTQNQVPFISNIASNQTWVPSVQRINLPQPTGITPSDPVLATPVQVQKQIGKEENHIHNDVDVEIKVKSTPQVKTPGQSVRKPNTRSQTKKEVFKLQRDSNTQTPMQMEQVSSQKKKGKQSIEKVISSSSSSEEENKNEEENKQSSDEDHQVNSASMQKSSSSSEDAEFTQHLEEDVNMMQEQRSKTIQNHSHSESEIQPSNSDQEMPEQEENHNDLQEVVQSDNDDQSLEGEIPSGELKVLDEEVNLSNCAWRLQKDYLNDEIINFMLNLAFNCADPQIKNYTVVLNTFIYSYLADPNHTDERILKILKKKLRTDTLFLIIPINLAEQNHWSLAIIANVNLQLHPTHSFLQAFDKNKQPCPCFLYLDSLFKISLNTKTALNRACSLIMQLHHDNKYPKDAIYPYYSYRMNVPKQKNGIDCGVFLIEYVARFLKDPLSLIFNTSQQKEPIAFAFDHHLEDILSDFRMKPSDMDFALYIEAELRAKQESLLQITSLEEEVSKLFILRQIAEQTLNASQEKLAWFDGAIVDKRRRHMRNLFKFLARAEDPNAIAREAYMKYYPIKE